MGEKIKNENFNKIYIFYTTIELLQLKEITMDVRRKTGGFSSVQWKKRTPPDQRKKRTPPRGYIKKDFQKRRNYIRKNKNFLNNELYLDNGYEEEHFWWEKGKHGTMLWNERTPGLSYEDEVLYIEHEKSMNILFGLSKFNPNCDDREYCKNCKGCCNNKISEYYKIYHYNLDYFAKNNLFDHNKLTGFYFHRRCIDYYNQYLNLNIKKSLLNYIYFKEIEHILTILGVPSLCIVIIFEYLSYVDGTELYKKIDASFQKILPNISENFSYYKTLTNQIGDFNWFTPYLQPKPEIDTYYNYLNFLINI